MKFTWLHLTDFHLGMNEQSWLWPGVKKRFCEDLKKLHDKCGSWELVLFTGDLTQGGNVEEFQKLNEVLEELWEFFGSLGFSPRLLAVPGNHDLIRPDEKALSVKFLRQHWEDDKDVQTEFWEKAGSPYRKVINKAFTNYNAWLREEQVFKPVHDLHYGILPGDFSVTIEKDDCKLGIAGLNTAFLQLTDHDDYKSKLALHTRQFHAVCGGDGPEWIKQHHACLLLTHHPPEWLSPESKQHLHGEIAAHKHFAAHLCGHMHEDETVCRRISEGGAETPLLWQGRALFGLESFAKAEEKHRCRHGYAVGRIKLNGNENEGALIFWPRLDAPMQGGKRHIVPDYSIKLNDDCCISSSFSLHKPCTNLEADFFDERHKLVRHLKSLVYKKIVTRSILLEAYKASMPAVRHECPDFSKDEKQACHEAIDDIAVLPEKKQDALPLLKFSCYVADKLPSSERNSLAALISKHFSTSCKDLKHKSTRQDIVTEKVLNCNLLVIVLPVDTPMDHYSVKVRRDNDETLAEGRDSFKLENTCDELQYALGKAHSKLMSYLFANGLCEENVWVRFLLPRQLLSEAVDQYKSDEWWGALGINFKITVSSWERARYPKYSLPVRTCWEKYQQRMEKKIQCAYDINSREWPEDQIPALIVSNCNSPSQLFVDTKDSEVPLAILPSPPIKATSLKDQTNCLNALLRAGVPVILWTRSAEAKLITSENKTENLIFCKQIFAELPKCVYEERKAAFRTNKPSLHIGCHLTLLWDDPTLRIDELAPFVPIEKRQE